MCPDLGSYLQRLRIKKNLTLRSVSHKTKIRESILEQIENGETIQMPLFVQKSYIKSFSQVVGADQQKVEVILQSSECQDTQVVEQVSFLSKLPTINKLATALVTLFIVSLTWFLNNNKVNLEISETASYNLEAKYYQKEALQPLPSNIESLLNSPSPSFDKNTQTP